MNRRVVLPKFFTVRKIHRCFVMVWPLLFNPLASTYVSERCDQRTNEDCAEALLLRAYIKTIS